MNYSVSITIFLIAVVFWCIVRYCVKIPEMYMRVFWGLGIAAFAVPAFFGLDSHILVTSIVWPFAAGLMVGERALIVFRKMNERNRKKAEESGVEIPEFKKTKKKNHSNVTKKEH